MNISRRWLLCCIISLTLTILLLISIYFYAPLLKWEGGDHNMKLTPFFFVIDGNEYFYMSFRINSSACSNAGIDSEGKVCKVLKNCFFANSLLNLSLLLGFILTVSAIILAIAMLKRYFCRFTNIFILLSGLNFIVMTIVWIPLSGTLSPDVKKGTGLFFIPLAGAN